MSNIKRFLEDKEEAIKIVEAGFLDEFHRYPELNIGEISFGPSLTERVWHAWVKFTYYRDKYYIPFNEDLNWEREKYKHFFEYNIIVGPDTNAAIRDLIEAFERYDNVAELQDRIKEYQREIKDIKWRLKNEFSPIEEAAWKLRR